MTSRRRTRRRTAESPRSRRASFESCENRGCESNSAVAASMSRLLQVQRRLGKGCRITTELRRHGGEGTTGRVRVRKTAGPVRPRTPAPDSYAIHPAPSGRLARSPPTLRGDSETFARAALFQAGILSATARFLRHRRNQHEGAAACVRARPARHGGIRGRGEGRPDV